MIKILNRVKTFANYVSGRHLFTIYPAQVAIEISNYCNLRCTVCPHSRMTRQKRTMELETFCRLIDKISLFADFVFLYGIGESLFCNQLPEMIDYASNADLFTYLSTNSLLMDDKWSERLLDSRLDSITFALDGSSKETYESIRVGADFDEVIGNIKRFLRLKIEKSSTVEVVIQLIYMEQNSQEMKDFHRLFSPEERKAINRFRFKPFIDSFAKRQYNGHPTDKCFFLWNSLFIYSDCRVGLCCVDYDAEFVLGDLQQETMEQIWNSERIERVRKSHSSNKNKPAMCLSCVIPDLNYFKYGLLIGTSLLPTGFMRKFIPIYEKLFLLNK